MFIEVTHPTKSFKFVTDTDLHKNFQRSLGPDVETTMSFNRKLLFVQLVIT